ncbi:MAG TPA: hypothetical protein VFI24_06905 [Pyrinomonadaceae bacterium]|nr:hypothetical protein [Pyrinomonadaceae bacterium]
MNDFPFEDAAMPYSPEASTSSSPIENVKQNHEDRLMAIEGVEGVGLGRNSIGDDAIIVYLRSEDVKGRIPSDIDGHPVETKVTGIIEAQDR